VPPALARIAERAMAKEPGQRFRSARQLAQALRVWQAERPSTRGTADDADEGASVAQRNRLIIAGAAAVGLIGIGVFAWLRFFAAPAPQPAVAQAAPAVVPASAPAASAPEPASAVVVADAASAPEDAASQAATAAASAAEPASHAMAAAHRKIAKKKTDTVPAAAPAAPPPMGLLHLAITPWGNVEVDGQPAGTAPPLNHLNLPAGTHTITVRNADFPPYTATVRVSADEPTTFKYHFGS
jgi:serine/threonine-protein kinase